MIYCCLNHVSMSEHLEAFFIYHIGHSSTQKEKKYIFAYFSSIPRNVLHSAMNVIHQLKTCSSKPEIRERVIQLHLPSPPSSIPHRFQNKRRLLRLPRQPSPQNIPIESIPATPPIASDSLYCRIIFGISHVTLSMPSAYAFNQKVQDDHSNIIIIPS